MTHNRTLKRKATRPATTIDDMQRLAKKHGGKCLSKKYIAGRLKLTWQCKKGHTWDATGQSIKNQKSWCPKCAGRIHDIPYMQNLAKKKGGLCLSKEFVSVMKKLRWQCDKGHQWEAVPMQLKNGSWCPECVRPTFTIEDMHKFAKTHNATCLSSKYIAYRGTKLRWQCKKGHTFMASYENLKRPTRKEFCITCKQQTGSSRIKKRNKKTLPATTTTSKWKNFIIDTLNKSPKPLKIMDICTMAIKHFNVKSDPDKKRAYRNILTFVSRMTMYDELKRVKKIGRDIYVSIP